MERRPILLIADDEQVIRDLLADYIKSSLFPDAEIREAGDGEAALGLLDPEVDLVITDIKMPRMTGLELLKQISQRAPWAQTVVITGYATLDNAMSALKLGAFDFLLKPFESLDHVGIALRNAYDKACLLRSNAELVAALEHSNVQLEQRVKERTAELADANERLWRLTRNAEDILASASHDLRGRLSALASIVDLAAGALETDKTEARECLDLGREQVNALLELTGELVQYARVGLSERQGVVVSIGDLFAMVLQGLEADTKDLVKVEIEPQDLTIEGDKEQLLWLFLTLVKNAAGKSQELPDRSIRLFAYPKDEGILAGVESNWTSGFKAALTLDTPRNQRPQELGLSVAKKIAHSHGGMLRTTLDSSGPVTVAAWLPTANTLWWRTLWDSQEQE